MTERTCILCGPPSAGKPHAKVGSHLYLRCSSCGLLYVDRIESADMLYQSYDGGFWKSLRRKLVMPFRSFSGARHFEQSMERARRIYGQTQSQWAAPPSGNPRWLDIGCNKGFLLAAALEHSWDVYGIEIVPELILPFQREFKKFSGQIYSGRFTDNQKTFQDQFFDVVTAIDVIEHFEDPLDDLRNIFRILKPGGLFLFQTPDSEAPQAGELGERWGALKPLEHLHLFNKDNLKTLSKKLGFREIRFFEAFDSEDGNLAGVMRK